jgi:hypothetical protein
VAASDEWFAVRSLFRLVITDPPPEQIAYEERITLWRASSSDEAVGRAEAEARQYARTVDSEYLIDFGQAYHLFEPPGDGSEVFSLIRDSTLDADAYVDHHFDTGTERQR